MDLLAQAANDTITLRDLVDWAIRISVPIMILVLTGAARVVWKLNERQSHLESTAATKEEVALIRSVVQINSSDTAVLKSNQIETSRRLERMEEKLDRLLERE